VLCQTKKNLVKRRIILFQNDVKVTLFVKNNGGFISGFSVVAKVVFKSEGTIINAIPKTSNNAT
jgi:hypothetical protein